MGQKTLTEFKIGMKNLKKHTNLLNENVILWKEDNVTYQTNACSVNPFTDFKLDIFSPKTVEVDKPFFDGMNWKDFWKVCKENFPLHSVKGNGKSEKDILSMEKDYIKTLIIPYTGSNLKGKKMLEIGYGYGGTGLELLREYNADYYGIDYVASDESLLHKEKDGKLRFYEISESGIPSGLMDKKYDVIFSINVMQHLTRKQREDYFKQIAECLSDDGVFIFTCFEWNYSVTKKIREDYNTKFFGVKTSIEGRGEMRSLLSKCGLSIKKKDYQYESACHGETNVPIYVVKKKKNMAKKFIDFLSNES